MIGVEHRVLQDGGGARFEQRVLFENLLLRDSACRFINCASKHRDDGIHVIRIGRLVDCNGEAVIHIA